METARLILRELTTNDALALYKLNINYDVVRFTGDKAFESIEAAKEFLENYDQYKKYGIGRWAVEDKKSKEFLGWCGLRFDPETKEYDLGFRFYKQHWNKGYATETAKFCLQMGFETLGLKKIVGRVKPENKASIRVLEKIGMVYNSQIVRDNTIWYEYRIQKTTKKQNP